MGLYQCVDQSAHGENFLNLEFVNYPVNVIASNVLSPIATSDRSAVSLL